MSKACLVCNSLNSEMISIFRHTKKLHKILWDLLGLQAKEDDHLCKDCCNETIKAYDAKQKQFAKDRINALDSEDKIVIPSDSEIKIELKTEFNLEENFEDLGMDCESKEEIKLYINKNGKNRAKQKDFKTFSSIELNVQKSLKEVGNVKKTCTVRKYFYCPECGKQFCSVLLLDEHTDMEHSIYKNNYLSTSHIKDKRKKDPMKHEIPYLKESISKLYVCVYCKGIYKSKGDIEDHLRKHTAGLLRCSLCKKEFSTLSNLKAHQKIHTGEKPHKCFECGKNFYYKVDLKRHMTSHTGAKLYSCFYCPKRYGYKVDLIRHLRKKHETEGKANELKQRA